MARTTLTTSIRQLPLDGRKTGWGGAAPGRRWTGAQGWEAGSDSPQIGQFSGRPGEETCLGKGSLSVLLQSAGTHRAVCSESRCSRGRRVVTELQEQERRKARSGASHNLPEAGHWPCSHQHRHNALTQTAAPSALAQQPTGATGGQRAVGRGGEVARQVRKGKGWDRERQER